MAQHAVTSSTIDAGGGALIGSTYELHGTIGQPDASSLQTGSAYELTGGFWRASPPTSACAADLNGDGSTNVADFSIFAANFGDNVAPFTNGDLNGDGIVNISDFTIFAVDFGCMP